MKWTFTTEPVPWWRWLLVIIGLPFLLIGIFGVLIAAVVNPGKEVYVAFQFGPWWAKRKT